MEIRNADNGLVVGPERKTPLVAKAEEVLDALEEGNYLTMSQLAARMPMYSTGTIKRELYTCEPFKQRHVILVPTLGNRNAYVSSDTRIKWLEELEGDSV